MVLKLHHRYLMKNHDFWSLNSPSWSLTTDQHRIWNRTNLISSLCLGGRLSTSLTLVLIQPFDISESTRGDIVKKALCDFNTFLSPSGYPSSWRSPDTAFKSGSVLAGATLPRSGWPALRYPVYALTVGCWSKQSSYSMTSEGCRVQ